MGIEETNWGTTFSFIGCVVGDAIPKVGSPALPLLSNKEKAARTGLGRQLTSTHYVRDDFLEKTSLNAAVHWFLCGSTQWQSTQSAEEP